MRGCYEYVTRWMQGAGMRVEMDAAGNVRGFYRGEREDAGRVLIGSHLDTVPNAGAYDGVLGVVLAVSLVEALRGERLPFGIEVIGFSEEEGVRFGMPFIGSKALAGELDGAMLAARDREGVSVEEAIRAFGLDAARLPEARLAADARAYLEFHIEQGPVLDRMSAALAVVDGIAGQSRLHVTFRGEANHAGTTPMEFRRDALCGAAEWIGAVERSARETDGLVATVGRMEAKPSAGNVIAGEARASLDVRHRKDAVRRRVLDGMLERGEDIAQRRGLRFEHEVLLEQDATPMDEGLTLLAERAIRAAGAEPHRMASGAGHDAMILARKLPSTMIFLRSPGGVSHRPDERVNESDVELALRAGAELLRNLSTCLLLT